jgi:hypothetical protein
MVEDEVASARRATARARTACCANAMQVTRRSTVSVRCQALERKKILMMGEANSSGHCSRYMRCQPPISLTLVDLDCVHANGVVGEQAVNSRAEGAHWHVCTHAGGTRFIGLYLARQLVEQGHDVTLYTRGKKPVDAMIPDDTRESHAQFRSRINHISGDRMVCVLMSCSLMSYACLCSCTDTPSMLSAQSLFRVCFTPLQQLQHRVSHFTVMASTLLRRHTFVYCRILRTSRPRLRARAFKVSVIFFSIDE